MVGLICFGRFGLVLKVCFGMVGFGLVLVGLVWYGKVCFFLWCGMVWFGMEGLVWYCRFGSVGLAW